MNILADLNLLTSKNLPTTQPDKNTVQTVITDAFILMGAIAILMIVIGGLRYIFARGNAENTAQAKNMILYSVMGLVIAAVAGTLVNFVLGRVG